MLAINGVDQEKKASALCS